MEMDEDVGAEITIHANFSAVIKTETDRQVNGNTVRNKWKALKDQNRKVPCILHRSSQDGITLSYFHSSDSSEDQFTVMPAIGKVELTNVTENGADSDMEDTQFEDIPRRPLPSPSLTSDEEPDSKSTASIKEAQMKVELEKLKHETRRAQENDDCDMNFLKSLLPDIKQLSTMQKLNFKIAVMKAMQESLTLEEATYVICSDVTEQTLSQNDYN
ncbi:uncharacterized protein [Periplaneta americana]|uniref:uncharacterized protein n=1 Tax=Periplaneta americana TaxID=6978 RepID=UPI0037E8D969